MQKIPKIIHYCWFGGNPHPELMRRCIQSWQRFCPDYELREWNEHTFDITTNTYTRQAYEARRWAFVTDYVRLYALYTQGGIYMDTDVELLQPLDAFLGEEGFSGFESPDKVPTGLMAACKGQAFIGELLREYDTRAFILPDGTADCTTNVEHITAAALRHGLRPDGTHQTVNGFTFYPSDYFCPIDFITMQYRPTANTHAIHHFSGSWLTPEQRERNVRYARYSRRYGKRAADALMRWRDSVQKRGMIRSVGKVIHKAYRKAGALAERLLCALLRSGAPVQTHVLFFESEEDFADNARALYEYLLTHAPAGRYRYIWKVSDADKYKRLYNRKDTVFIDASSFCMRLRLAYAIGRASTFFFTHPYWLTRWKRRQTVVNLWHGCGYKKAKGNSGVGQTFDYTLVTGDLYIAPHAQLFDCPPERILPLGLPRNDTLFMPPPAHILEKLGFTADMKCIFWMPTFRKSSNANISDDVTRSATGLPLAVSAEALQRINQVLAQNNLCMLIKLHPLQDEQAIAPVAWSHIRLMTNRMLADMGLTVYGILPTAAALLTDYSSIAIDYLLLDRPIGFILDDIEPFERSRGFIFDDVRAQMPGSHLYTLPDLEIFLQDIAAGRDTTRDLRLHMLPAAHRYADAHSSRRVAEHFLPF